MDAHTLYVENDTFPAPVDEDSADALAWSEVEKIVAVRPRRDGVAFVQVGVDARGDVACVALDRSSGDRRVDNAALRAAARIRWRPAMREGVASDGFVNIAVRGYRDDDEACARDFAWACHAAGHARDDVAMFERACTLGDVRACTDIGKAANDRALLERSCAARDGDACVALGDPLSFHKACELNDGEGCRRLALALADDEDVRALALLEIACTLRDVEACAEAGVRLRAGRGAPIDEARATKLLERARRRGVDKL